MASKTEIANLALTNLAAENIMDFYEASESATKIRTVYEHARNAVLSEHPWNFCSNDVQLGALINKPLIKYQYAFALPTELVRLNEVYSVDGDRLEPGSYRVTKDNTLQCNIAPIIINYNMIIEDESLFPPLFVQAFAARLAFETCYSITGSRTLQADMWELYNSKLMLSKNYNAVEDKRQLLRENERDFGDSWLEARY